MKVKVKVKLKVKLKVKVRVKVKIKVKLKVKIKVKQSHYRPEVPRGFQEVTVPRFCDNGTGWW